MPGLWCCEAVTHMNGSHGVRDRERQAGGDTQLHLEGHAEAWEEGPGKNRIIGQVGNDSNPWEIRSILIFLYIKHHSYLLISVVIQGYECLKTLSRVLDWAFIKFCKLPPHCPLPIISSSNVKVTKLGAALPRPDSCKKSKMMIQQSAIFGDNSCKICLIGPD